MDRNLSTAGMDSFLLSGSNQEESEVGEIQKDENPIPEYYNTDEFHKYLLAQEASEGVNECGYIFLLTDKQMYAAGDMIKGTVFIDMFKPCSSRELNIQFKCI